MMQPPLNEESFVDDDFCCVSCDYGICEECYESFSDCKCYDPDCDPGGNCCCPTCCGCGRDD